MYTEENLQAAKVLFEYLYLRDGVLSQGDIVIGFGHFDMRIPSQCGEIFSQGLAPKILFTGGRGAGTADIEGTEGEAFQEAVKRVYPEITPMDVIIEKYSTNTGENILFSEALLQEVSPDFCFSRINAAIAVACPYRQRRVYLSMKKLFPGVRIQNAPPLTTFQTEMDLYQNKHEDFVRSLASELARISTYPAKGFIAYEAIPPEVEGAYQNLLNSFNN